MKLSSIVKYLLSQLVGTKTAQVVIAFCEGGLADAVSALAKGDIAGFVAALPDAIKTQVEAYIAAQVAKLTAPVASAYPAAALS